MLFLRHLFKFSSSGGSFNETFSSFLTLGGPFKATFSRPAGPGRIHETSFGRGHPAPTGVSMCARFGMSTEGLVEGHEGLGRVG